MTSNLVAKIFFRSFINLQEAEMNIAPIFQQNYTPTMSGRRITGYKDLRHIPNVPCACCGEPVIVPELLTKAYSAITKSLSMVLSLGLMDKWKNNTTIWEMFMKFINNFPNKSLDKILENEQNRSFMISAIKESLNSTKNKESLEAGQVLQEMRSKSREKLRGAGAVMKRLQSFKDFLHDEDLEIFEQLQIYAEKYPRKSLSEIINMNEVYTYHKQRLKLQSRYLTEKRNFHYNNIKTIITKTNPEAAQNCDKLMSTIQNLYKTYWNQNDYCTYLINCLIERFLKENNCEKASTKVFKELKQVPPSTKSFDQFFCYAKNKQLSDFDIIYHLLSPVESTFEHIVPKVKGKTPQGRKGLNHTSNGLVMHRICNTRRGSLPYKTVMMYNPLLPYNIQKQLDFLANLILKGELEGDIEMFPIKVSKTLACYTGRAITPDYEEYCQKIRRKQARKVRKSKEELRILHEKLTEIRDAFNKQNLKTSKDQNILNSIEQELKNLSKP